MEQFVAAGVFEIPVIAGAVLLAPVEGVGIVEAELDAVFLTSRLQILHRIAGKGSGLDDGGVADLGIIHGETVVMFRGDDEVSHAGFLRELDPFIRIELRGVEFPGDFLVIDGDRNLGHALDVLAVAAVFSAIPRAAQIGIHAPMHEHAEAGIAPPAKAGIALGSSGNQFLARWSPRGFTCVD